MNNTLELAQDRIIETVGNLCSKFGLNNFMAQLYIVLYMSNKPLSLDDLAQRLKASKGNVSINIRELERWGAVRKVWVRGSRKDFYEAELGIKKILAERIKASAQKHLAEVSRMLDEFNGSIKSAYRELTEEEKNIAKVYESRLKKIDELRGLLTQALGLVGEFI